MRRFNAPPQIPALPVMIVAAIGIVVNLGAAWLVREGHEQDLNRRGAFLHLIADAAVSLAAVIAGAGIWWLGWAWLDPAIALLVSVVVAVGAFGLLRDAFNAAMDAVPPSIRQTDVQDFLASQPGVQAVHHLHIWSLGAGEIAMTAHLVRPMAGTDLGEHDAFIDRLNRELDQRFGINHPTLQVELGRACEHDRHDRAPHGAHEHRHPHGHDHDHAHRGGRPGSRSVHVPAAPRGRGCAACLYNPAITATGPEPAMLNDIKKDAQTRMAKSVDAFRHDLIKIRTGRATTALVDHLKVNYYGSDMPLSQVATVAISDARSLTITPWEKQMVGAVEKAILASDLGLTPNTAGTVIRLNLPALTEERRKELSKLVHSESENAKVAIRNIRRDANHQVKELLKDKQVTEDDVARAETEIQKITDAAIKDVDEVVKAKEQELMAV